MTGLGSLATTGQATSSSSSSEGSTSLAREGDFSLTGLGSLASTASSLAGEGSGTGHLLYNCLGNLLYYGTWAGLLGHYRPGSLLLFLIRGSTSLALPGWGGRFLTLGARHLLYNCLGNLLYYFLTGWCWGLFFDWAGLLGHYRPAPSSSSSEGSTTLAGEGDFSLTGLGSLATNASLAGEGDFSRSGLGTFSTTAWATFSTPHGPVLGTFL